MPSPRLMPAVALVLPLALAGSGGCDIATANFHAAARDQWQKTYELAPDGRVEVINVNGRITVEPSTGRQVEVVAEKTARGASEESARQALAQIQIEDSATPSGITIETKAPRTHGVFSGSTEVRYTVKVPAGARVHFRTVNGGIDMSRLSGEVDAETTNGGIVARDVAGSIKASTTNGGIDIDMTSLGEAGATLECVNGGITLRLPADARATVSASIANGGIDTTGLSLDTTDNSRRRLEGRLNGGGAPIHISGTNGGISLRAR